MKAVVLIPARLESNRFPEKVIYPILGKPMIEWVYKGASQSKLSDGVFVVTNSEKIKRVVEEFGGRVIYIKREYSCGTDRIADAVDRTGGDVVINVQGDEPLVDGEVVDTLIEAFKDGSVQMATLAREFQDGEDPRDPNVVKVVVDRNGNSLYFSRSLIPYGGGRMCLRHIGIYGYRRETLKEFVLLPRGTLEEAEKLEQLRALEAGWKIKVIKVNKKLINVDVLEDVKKVEEVMRKRL